MTINETFHEQEISVPLTVGSRVQLLEDTEVEKCGEDVVGGAESITFEDYVEQYNPGTGLLQFEESDIGRVEFIERLQEADGYKVIRDESVRNV